LADHAVVIVAFLEKKPRASIFVHIVGHTLLIKLLSYPQYILCLQLWEYQALGIVLLPAAL